MRVRRQGGDDLISRCDDVRFRDMVKCCGSFRAVAGNGVVNTRGGVRRLHGTHRDDVGIITGSRDGAVAFRASAIVAALVAGRGQHHYA